MRKQPSFGDPSNGSRVKWRLMNECRNSINFAGKPVVASRNVTCFLSLALPFTNRICHFLLYHIILYTSFSSLLLIYLQCHHVWLGPSLKKIVGGRRSIKKRVKREHVVGPKLMIKARLGVISKTLGVSIQLLENLGAGYKDRSLKKLVNFFVVVGKRSQGRESRMACCYVKGFGKEYRLQKVRWQLYNKSINLGTILSLCCCWDARLCQMNKSPSKY